MKDASDKPENPKKQENKKETLLKKIESYEKTNSDESNNKLDGVSFEFVDKEDIFKGCFFKSEE